MQPQAIAIISELPPREGIDAVITACLQGVQAAVIGTIADCHRRRNIGVDQPRLTPEDEEKLMES